MKKLQVLLLSTLIASPAVALADSNLEFYGKAGIPGVGVGVGAGVHDKVSVVPILPHLALLTAILNKIKLSIQPRSKPLKAQLPLIISQ